MAGSSSPHRPRKRQKATHHSNTTRDHAVAIDPKTNNQIPAFPLASFFWPARKSTSQWVIIPLVLMIVGLFRWCAGLWGYSGFQTPPMHGDYEAQRHWMEITTHLPMSQWYFYDLQYWGLDYPPLTAYHSWVLGKIGSFINPSWFALYTSRGKEEQLLKVFMRATVVISEYLIYIPSAVLLNRQLSQSGGVNTWESSIALVAILMQPSTILIDHAHFQYNTVMLGFVLYSLYSIHLEQYFFASIFFVAALSFKQMSLYYAPPTAFYFLGTCFAPKARPLRFLGISFGTILAFAAVLAPLMLGTLYDNYRAINPPLSLTDREVNPVLATLTPYIHPSAPYYPYLLQLTQLLHRVFPFARGIFEDKVANLWNAVHTIHKLTPYAPALLQRLSLLTTLILIEPSIMLISLYPSPSLLPWALSSSAFAFFLASFQVHEKSILLPLLPLTILLGGRDGLGVESRAWIGWANVLGAWTLFPLLKRDGLQIPYFVLTGLWAYLLALPPTSLSCYFGGQAAKSGLRTSTKILHLVFYVAMLAWHVGEAYMSPPDGKPDLWVVLNTLTGAAGFTICYLWTTWQLILRTNVLEEWLGFRADQDGKAPEDRAKALPLNYYWSEKTADAGERKEGKAKGKATAKTDIKAETLTKNDGQTQRKTKSRTSTASLSPTPEPGSVATRRSPRKKKAG